MQRWIGVELFGTSDTAGVEEKQRFMMSGDVGPAENTRQAKAIWKRAMLASGLILISYVVFWRFDVRALSGFDLVFEDTSPAMTEGTIYMDPFADDHDVALVRRIYISKWRRIMSTGTEGGPTIIILKSGKVVFTNGVLPGELDGMKVIYAL